jgi:putative glutathione S-transferase
VEQGWYDTASVGGAFRRGTAGFRNWVTADGSAGPTGTDGYAAGSGRYHLYVSCACPWAHRTMIFRTLKGLEPYLGISVVHPDMLTEGWTFATDFPGTTGDAPFGLPFLRDLYTRAVPDVSGRVTVPVLRDRHRQAIVSNESSGIIRMFNAAFDGLTGNSADFRPLPLRPAIDALNARIHAEVNDGICKAGFATSQTAHDTAVVPLFAALDWLEARLADRHRLPGDHLTEANRRLFPTPVRFDSVCHLHFKCNRRRIVDYPNPWDDTRALYRMPGVAETVHMDHILRHCHISHQTINPCRIIPVNPVPDFLAPQGR